MTILIPAWNNGNLEPVEKLEVHKRGLKHKASLFLFFVMENYLFNREHLINITHLNFGLTHAVLTQIGEKAQKIVPIEEYLKNLVLKT